MAVDRRSTGGAGELCGRRNIDPANNTDEELWHGGDFQLAIEVGPRSDECVLAVLEAIWEQDGFHGCFTERLLPFEEQQPNRPMRSSVLEESLYGLVRIDDRAICVCGTVIIRETFGPDWVVFYVPMGALGLVYSQVGAYPFVEASDEPIMRLWIEPVSEWLATIGVMVFRQVQYRLGLVGFEVSGRANREFAVPPQILKERYEGYLWPEDGEVKWYPPTRHL